MNLCPHLEKQEAISIGESNHCMLASLIKKQKVAVDSSECLICRREWIDGRPPDAEYPTTVVAALGGEEPGIAKKVGHFAVALVKHAANLAKNVDEKDYQERISICKRCKQLDKNVCNICGCDVNEKAKWASEGCPIGKWLANPGKAPGSPSEAHPMKQATPPPNTGGCGCGKVPGP